MCLICIKYVTVVHMWVADCMCLCCEFLDTSKSSVEALFIWGSNCECYSHNCIVRIEMRMLFSSGILSVVPLKQKTYLILWWGYCSKYHHTDFCKILSIRKRKKLFPSTGLKNLVLLSLIIQVESFNGFYCISKQSTTHMYTTANINIII